MGFFYHLFCQFGCATRIYLLGIRQSRSRWITEGFEQKKMQHNAVDKQKHFDVEAKEAIKVDYYLVRGEYIFVFTNCFIALRFMILVSYYILIFGVSRFLIAGISMLFLLKLLLLLSEVLNVLDNAS